jgi:hypothetical protein
MTIGYKLLTAEGRSITTAYGAIHYPLDGSWIDVPGCGAFVGLSVPGLLRGGFGPLLAEVKCEDRRGGDAECPEMGRVRVMRTATIDIWTIIRVAIRAARDVAHLCPDPRVLAAIEAAERCERERMPEAARAAARAAAEAEAAWAAEAAAWAAEAAARAAEAAARAAAWASQAAAWAAWTAEEAARAAAWAAWTAEEAARAASMAAWTLQAGARARILDHLVAEAWPGAERPVVPDGR